MCVFDRFWEHRHFMYTKVQHTWKLLSVYAQKPYFFPKWNYLSSCHQFLVHNSKTVTQEGHRWARTIECLCRQHKEPFIIGKGFWECYTADLGESFNRNRSRFVIRKRADFQVKCMIYLPIDSRYLYQVTNSLTQRSSKCHICYQHIISRLYFIKIW